ncbi:MAG: DUF2924 domain-containing protein [Veillonellaceae bacterium]|nr:DUF2924 domain-containing protein [Veillonellaceae bacterium]
MKTSKTKKQAVSKKATKKQIAAPAVAESPKPTVPAKSARRKSTPPTEGTVLVRKYKNQEYTVKVLEKGFECNGLQYRSLTALAKDITGAKAISGYAFFKC